MPHRTSLVVALVAAIAVSVPAGAEAATISSDLRTPHELLLYADHDETNLVSVTGSQSVIIRDDGAPLSVEGVPTCMPLDERSVSCAAVKRVQLVLGNGPDVATIATPKRVSIEGGIGNDRYNALAGAFPSRVAFDGGYGTDTASYFYASAGVDVSIDRDADDGRPGDEDRVGRTVESVIGSEHGDVLTGSERGERLSGSDGDDDITGGAGADVLLGGRGNDTIDARDGEPDTVDCGGYLLDRVLADPVGEASVTGCAIIE